MNDEGGRKLSGGFFVIAESAPARRARGGMPFASGVFGNAAPVILSAFVLLAAACSAYAQQLRFSNHREVQIPDYATLRLGPFYSQMGFSQSAGYRYTRSVGTGTDFLTGARRGVILEDGSEFPLISSLDLRNYLVITRSTDLDLSANVSYAHYPLKSQEDELNINIVEEGLLGNLSMEFALTRFIKGTVYENALYRTDFIDTRGIKDLYGGQRFEHFDNRLGSDLDWLIAPEKNVGLSVARRDVIPFGDEFMSQERVEYSESATLEQRLMPGLIAGAKAGFTQTYYSDEFRADTGAHDYSLYTRFGRGYGERRGLGMRLTDVSAVYAHVGYSAGFEVSAARQKTGTETQEDVVTTETGESDMAGLTGGASLETKLRKDLSHVIDYLKSLRGGFNSNFEIANDYRYKIRWTGKASSANLYTGLSVVEPSRSSVNEYSDWASGFDFSYPLVRYITLTLSSTYSDRRNRGAVTAADADEEWRSDYATWASEIGTSFAVTKRITFLTSVKHIERSSDSEKLEYTRDIFEATFLYRHEF